MLKIEDIKLGDRLVLNNLGKCKIGDLYDLFAPPRFEFSKNEYLEVKGFIIEGYGGETIPFFSIYVNTYGNIYLMRNYGIRLKYLDRYKSVRHPLTSIFT